jgi:hypothetical protein
LFFRSTTAVTTTQILRDFSLDEKRMAERKEEGKRRKSGGREKKKKWGEKLNPSGGREEKKKLGKKLDPAWIQLTSFFFFK